jgi:hypothetical protein
MNKGKNMKMGCACLVVSSITLVLVCVLVYMNFKPHVDGFDNHSTGPSVTVASVENANNATERQQATSHFQICMQTSGGDLTKCCENVPENLIRYLPFCPV